MCKEKLRELLKEVPEIKKDLEELRFGTEVFIQNYITSVIICGDNRGLTILEGTEYEEFIGQCGNHTQTFKEKHIKKIIGNPIEERHIRMYCENTKKLRVDFLQEYIQISNVFTKEKSQLIKLDNTKDLENQSETFYKELYEALLELNK